MSYLSMDLKFSCVIKFFKYIISDNLVKYYFYDFRVSWKYIYFI